MGSLIDNRILIVVLILFVSCEEKQENSLFTLMDEHTGVTFQNQIEETKSFNIMSYEYMYNGGGVAVADFNNDRHLDIFFIGNQIPNKLYLNQGNWKFDDITDRANVKGKKGWRTGVTIADVNSDGLQDIYVCYSGPGTDTERSNELLINQGGVIPLFVDKASEYNLGATGTYSTQASFFDFDLDGDLDMFLLNHAKITYSPFYNTKTLRNKRHPKYGNRLYRNDNGKFVDVSSEAGIHGSGINFGLGVSISDLNLDGWPDIYVTNDYEEQDFFYLNQHDGTFRECLKESFRHIARFGMGVDVADFNNDQLPDVFVADMLPEDNYRQKLLKGADEYDKYMLLRDSGYHHQNMRNMLQVNLGNSENQTPRFSEIGQLSGVSATDWSWSPLFADFDNDGWKDLFVTNGYLRDYTNLDFLKYTFEEYKKRATSSGTPLDTISLVKEMPSTRLTNYCFRNNGNLQFDNVSSEWGFQNTSVSNGAVYADLDNDGDQDLVVNNLNDKSFLYRNNSETKIQNHYVDITLKGSPGNTNAVGARIVIKTDSLKQLQEVFATRGFQSASIQPLHFGTGKSLVVRELIIQWPDRTFSKIENVGTDTSITISHGDHKFDSVLQNRSAKELFAEKSALPFAHTEADVIDYKREFLLPYQLSSNGPCIAKGDLNQDGYDDVFFGGAAGQKSELFLTKGNTFQNVAGPWYDDAVSEDTDAVFVDVDNDHDLDLYVVSGSHEFSNETSAALQDRLYVNQGNGNFIKALNALPKEKSNGNAVAFADFDKDGDQDLFIAGKTLPGYFPLPAYSLLLRNDSKQGEILFTDITPEELKKPGMLNDCLWADIDNDTWMDLVVAGDFTSILVAKNSKGTIEAPVELVANSSGMWSSLAIGDLDHDGDLDIIGGNAGWNTQLKASPTQPLTLQYQDYNADGKLDPILSYFVNGKSCVYPSRDEMLEQMPSLKKKFVKYGQYAGAALSDILSPEQINKSKLLQVQTLTSSVFVNDGKGIYKTVALPVEAQLSKVNAFIVSDFNNDGAIDILLAGNYYPYRVQMGRNDAGSGLLLLGEKGKLKYASLPFRKTGFYADGDVRCMQKMTLSDGEYVLIGVNNNVSRFYKINFNENSILANAK